MRHFLKSQVSEAAFAECLPADPPPYQEFLDAACERLSTKVSTRIDHLSGSIRPWGRNRVRIDGALKTTEGVKIYYVELVWLPSSNSYRGNASVWDTPPEPEPKSIDQFIAALNGIVNEDEIIFSAQAYNAAEGVDENSEDLPRAFPAMFSLFERFLDEDFGNPGILVHMMEARGGYEDELVKSLQRKPSIPAVTLVNRLLNSSLPQADRERWMHVLSKVANSDTADEAAKDYAREFLEYQLTRDNTEHDAAQDGESAGASSPPGS